MILVDGRLSFDALQRRLVTSPAKARDLVATRPASYVAFDLLVVGGVDLRTQRWTTRRPAWSNSANHGRYRCNCRRSPRTSPRPRSGSRVLPAAMGIEGLVIKGAATRYAGGQRAWLKVNSVGVAVFDELTRGTRDQVSNGSRGA